MRCVRKTFVCRRFVFDVCVVTAWFMERILQNTSFAHGLAGGNTGFGPSPGLGSGSAATALPHSFCTSHAVACADMIEHAAAATSPVYDYVAAHRAIHGMNGAASAQAPVAPGAGATVAAALGMFWSGRTNLDTIVFERDCGGIGSGGCPKPAAPLLRGRLAAHEGVAQPHGPPSLALRSAALATASPFGGSAPSAGAQSCVRGCMEACVASGRVTEACTSQCTGLCTHTMVDSAMSSTPVPLSW